MFLFIVMNKVIYNQNQLQIMSFYVMLPVLSVISIVILSKVIIRIIIVSWKTFFLAFYRLVHGGQTYWAFPFN